MSNEGNEQNALESYLPYLIDSSKVPTDSKKAKLDYEKKRRDKKITDMASAFGFAEPEESKLELVSKELNHFGVI